jgi:hypothetical protein
MCASKRACVQASKAKQSKQASKTNKAKPASKQAIK